ncbi:unnamed protein product [Somion occarium]|uniref:Uncharacterized protein n=1 Tax=Somion occarium TaxID=3059160 RepID=A0ABP1DJ96_9APHY
MELWPASHLSCMGCWSCSSSCRPARLPTLFNCSLRNLLSSCKTFIWYLTCAVFPPYSHQPPLQRLTKGTNIPPCNNTTARLFLFFFPSSHRVSLLYIASFTFVFPHTCIASRVILPSSQQQLLFSRGHFSFVATTPFLSTHPAGPPPPFLSPLTPSPRTSSFDFTTVVFSHRCDPVSLSISHRIELEPHCYFFLYFLSSLFISWLLSLSSYPLHIAHFCFLVP